MDADGEVANEMATDDMKFSARCGLEAIQP